jgi:hypothetical protein
VLGLTAKSSEELLDKVLLHPAFKSALGQGSVVKSLGKGGFGSVDLMETTIKGIGGEEKFL